MAYITTHVPRRALSRIRHMRPTLTPNVPQPVITFNPEHSVVWNMISALGAVMGWGWKLGLRDGGNSAVDH